MYTYMYIYLHTFMHVYLCTYTSICCHSRLFCTFIKQLWGSIFPKYTVHLPPIPHTPTRPRTYTLTHYAPECDENSRAQCVFRDHTRR